MTDQPTDIDAIPWGDPAPERIETSTPRKCRHDRRRRTTQIMHPGEEPTTFCDMILGGCGHVFDGPAVRRNRNNRKRGNSIERLVCADLGVTPRGRFGDAVDGGSDADPYLVQVKTGGYYKPQQQAILDAMDSQRHGRPAVLVTVETPGPGRKARRLVTMTYEDFVGLTERLAEQQRVDIQQDDTADDGRQPD